MLGERSDLNLKPVSCSRQYGGGGLPPHHHNSFTALFRDHPGEPVPEENFWTLWCNGRSTEADTPTIRLVATPSGLTSTHLGEED